ncbi:MAG TPA: MFS transporter, partial [Alicyclobacillus sp.]|nr:MFS transporter [Alicyclobacillus sp.]
MYPWRGGISFGRCIVYCLGTQRGFSPLSGEYPDVGAPSAILLRRELCFIYFMWITGFWGFGFWMPTVLKSVSGWSNASIGWLIVIPMAVALIGFIVTGNSSARTGEKRWHVAIPMFIGTVGMGLGPFVANPLLSFILVCVSAVGVYVGMGVWWTYPTSFLSGAAAAGAVGLINSVGNLGGWVGPYLVGFVKDRTGSFTGAYLYLAFSLLVAGLLIL